MKTNIAVLFFLLVSAAAHSQIYITRTGSINFYSQTPLEDIKAVNNQVYAVINTAKKEIAFTLLLKGFEFRKELMQTHFNENYVESDKYPKATFTGTYTGDVATSGVSNIQVQGSLTLHGTTKNVQMPATLELSGGKLTGHSRFRLTPGDFAITIPALVREKIAKDIDVDVMVTCDLLK